MAKRNQPCEDLGTECPRKKSKWEGPEVGMSLDAGETEGRPPWLGPKQGHRGRRGPIMLGFEAVVIINVTFLIFQLLAWRRSALLGPLDGAMGPVLANELSVEVACVSSGLSH